MPNFTSGERRGTILLLILITIIVAIMAMCRRNATLDSVTLQPAVIESASDTISQVKIIKKAKHKNRKKQKSDDTKSAQTDERKRNHLDETLELIE